MDIANMVQTGDCATIIQAVEMIGSDAVVLGSIPVTGKGTYRISFKPTGSSVQLWVLGAYDIILKPTCYTYPVTTQETYLVDICDENKDRYRFGFNGQEKVNELAGMGNHNTAEFWEYDTRTGRRWNVDPVDQINISNYAVNGLNPNTLSDPKGDVAGDYYKSNGEYLGNDSKPNDNKVYVADAKNTDGSFENAKELNIPNGEFQNNSYLIQHESSRAGDENTALWVAHTVNNALQNKKYNRGHTSYNTLFKSGFSSAKSEDKAKLLSPTDNSFSANAARRGMISVLTGQPDPTGGALFWDGLDLVSDFGGKTSVLQHPKFKQYKSVTIERGTIKEMLDFWSDPNNRKYVNRHSIVLKNDFEIREGMYRNNFGVLLNTNAVFSGARYDSNRKGSNASEYLKATGHHGGTIFWTTFKLP